MSSYVTSPVWKEAKLSLSGRPILEKNEREIAIQDNIGLYQDDLKLLDYQYGRIYLTSRRIIYVCNDIKSVKLSSIYLSLLSVQAIELYSGFLKSSPKIIIYSKEKSILTDRNSQSLKNSRTVNDINWVCPICYFSNLLKAQKLAAMMQGGNELPVCNSCGVKAEKELIEKILMEDQNNSKKQEVDLLTFDGSQCPVCTFINHPSMQLCEMCGTRLVSSNLHPDLLNAINNTDNDISLGIPLEFSSEIHSGLVNKNIIKLSFRKGGSKAFYDRLQDIIEQAEWNDVQESNGANKGAIKLNGDDYKNLSTKVITEKFSTSSLQDKTPQSVGIHGLQVSNSRKKHETSLLLSNSLQDLENLMAKGKELIKLGKSYQHVLMSANEHSSNQIDENLLLLRNSKASIKILDSILTKDDFSRSYSNSTKLSSLLNLKKTSEKKSSSNKSGYSELYIEELSRQLHEFILDENILDKHNGLITLYELYNMYNKAMGINLISPLELFDAVSLFEKLNLNLKLTEIMSKDIDKTKEKLYIVSKNKISSYSLSRKLLSYLIECPGISILEFQKLDDFKMNYLIIQALLNNLLSDGDIVIDQMIQGEFYYPNRILQYEWTTEKSVGNLFKSESLEVKLQDPVDTHCSKETAEPSTSSLISLFKSSNNNSLFTSQDRFKEFEDLDFN